MSRAKELGTLLSREEGKTLAEGTGEVMRAARILKYFAGEALRRHGQTLEFDAARRSTSKPIARRSACSG